MVQAKHYVLLLAVLFSFFSCEISENQEENTHLDTVPQEDLNDVKQIFANIPSPVEVNEVLIQMGGSFSPKTLNPIANAQKYSSSSVMALNLGIYLADLSYCNAHKKNQEVLEYFQGIRKLCTELAIEQVIDLSIMKRFDEKKNDNTALLQLIIQLYEQTYGILQQNNRAELAQLIVLGAWLEGTYFNLNLLQQKKHLQLVKLLSGQQQSFLHLYSLFEKHPIAGTSVITNQNLLEINQLLGKLFARNTLSDIPIDSTATPKSFEELNPDTFNQLIDKIITLRNHIIAAT